MTLRDWLFGAIGSFGTRPGGWSPSLVLLVLCSAPRVLGAQEAEQSPPDSAATSDSVATETVLADTLLAEVIRAEEILAELDQLTDTMLALESASRDAGGEDLELARVRGVGYVDRIHELQRELLDLAPTLDGAGEIGDSVQSAFERTLTTEFQLYQRAIERYNRRLAELRAGRGSTALEDLPDLGSQVDAAESRVDELLDGQSLVLMGADSIGLDVEETWAYLDAYLIDRAGNLVGRLQLAVDERGRMRARVRDATRAGTAESEAGPLRQRLQIEEQRVSLSAAHLSATADLLDRRGLETVQYRQFVIRATGEVSGDILNPRVLWGVLKDFANDVWSWAKRRGPTWIVQVLIILGFILLFRILFKGAWWGTRVLGRLKGSKLLADLMGRTVGPLATVVGLLAGLAFIGVNPTALLAGMGVLGVIVGLALQDSMSNLAAGMFILVYQPYDVEDVVTAGGVVGKVRAMGLANTTIVTFDNRRMSVPNRKIWNEVIENRSAERVRRAEAIVRVGYEHSVDGALDVIRNALADYDPVLHKPEPSVFVSRWADSWIEITVWGWTANDDWWTATTELPQLIRNRFGEQGIEVPLPRWQVVQGEADSPGPP